MCSRVLGCIRALNIPEARTRQDLLTSGAWQPWKEALEDSHSRAAWPQLRRSWKQSIPEITSIAADDMYGGTYRLFERVRRRSAGLNFSYVDMRIRKRSGRQLRSGLD